ncbi:MAG: non-canonical purine NTP pyrophosphatase, partial [Nitrosopumilaceae archaeon]|nr:non-canonical purine NTP pyrophosphatase [Nitrosopumilaceae archaeon]
MQQSYDVYFASSNRNKFLEAQKILNEFKINVEFFKYSLQEIQSNSLEKIASQKIDNAFNQCKKPVIIEDDGLFIDSLKGFPG